MTAPNLHLAQSIATDTVELERMAARLEASADYRILRRLPPVPEIHPAGVGPTRRAVFVDVETTGLDPAADAVIELAMAAFEYSEGGRIVGVGESFSAFRDPGRPIPLAITALTGITDAMVKGATIEEPAVAAFVGSADLVIAHHAAFDRPFCEALCDAFAAKAWACSLREVPWREEGFGCAQLAHLAIGHGLFFDGHRALHDCRAGIEILSRPLPRSGRTALAVLLESARSARWRVWAEGAPYAFRDTLKRRGYRWNDGSDGSPRAWYLDVGDEALEDESAFLRSQVYRRKDVKLDVRRVTAFERYSNRPIGGSNAVVPLQGTRG
jgi:DNA polymerase III subunit epsilon